MVGGRLGKLCKVPLDFLRSLRTEIERYLVGICNSGGCADQAISCILAEISRCIEIPRKCSRKLNIESREKLSEEGQDTSATSLRTSYEDFRPISGDILSASPMPKPAQIRQPTSFWFRSRDASRSLQNAIENGQKCGRRDIV